MHDAESTQILTVSALTHEIRGVVGTTFSDVWVRGEISQPRRPPSGHVYLTLKDEHAVLSGVIWRSTAGRIRFRPEEGQEVLARGRIEVYPPRGSYQLIISELQPLGEGALRLAFEQLRRKLEAEGLFDQARKRPLPAMPRRIALVTSRTGAAVRDMVTVIRRRFPGVVVLLVPVLVQGEGAAREIAAGLAYADAHARADVIIAGRGGGSLEDLWAFNEEIVAHAIAACTTPVVSAVGHETDTTIADLVADVRAATPSQAGELVVPVREQLIQRLEDERARLAHRMRVRLDRAWQRLEAVGDRPVLRTPESLVEARRRTVAHLARALAGRSPARTLERRRAAIEGLSPRLLPPVERRLSKGGERLGEARRRLGAAGRLGWERSDRHLEGLRLRLRALSPLAVLGRGYSLTRRLGEDGAAPVVVRSGNELREGDLLRTRLGDGAEVDSRVERIREAQEGEPA